MKNPMDRQLEKLTRRTLALKKADAAADITALEREIDDHVYRLYGLTAKQIKLMKKRVTKLIGFLYVGSV